MTMYTTQIVDGDEVRSLGSSGYELISGKDKVRQDVRMVFSTDIRPTTGLGSKIEDSVGQETENPATAHSSIPFMFEFQMSVKSALDRLKRAQRQFHFAYRIPAELIHDFSAVQIWPVASDPRNFRWKVDIQTIDGAGLSIKGGVRS